jgi:hypothetical protein
LGIDILICSTLAFVCNTKRVISDNVVEKGREKGEKKTKDEVERSEVAGTSVRDADKNESQSEEQ